MLAYFIVPLAAIALFVFIGSSSFSSSSALPAHLLGHPVRYFPSLLSASVREELMNLTRTLWELPGVTSAESSYAMTHEHIGEGFDHPTAPDGSCSHAFLAPSSDGRMCILPGRIDVGRHYVATGGFEALKEQHAQLISRVQSFIKYIFSPLEYSVTARLFSDEGFLAAARSVCPAHKPVLDPFQTTLIAQVPGQTVPAHLDGVWFHGASRFHVPQWLLAVMAFSGLFADRFIDQVQLVAYFHEWKDSAGARGGNFVHWADGSEATLSPEPGSGNAVDGSKTVHAATLFEPGAAAAPTMDKNLRHALVYNASLRTWGLVSGGQPRGAALAWTEEQLRFSVVYRARCFRSDAERADFAAALAAREGLMDLEKDILLPLMREAVRRGGAPSLQAVQAMPRLDLGMLLLQTFIRYPKPALSRAWIPFNYCALPRLYPGFDMLARAVNWLCPLAAA